jgi:hypothetical protein
MGGLWHCFTHIIMDYIEELFDMPGQNVQSEFSQAWNWNVVSHCKPNESRNLFRSHLFSRELGWNLPKFPGIHDQRPRPCRRIRCPCSL